MDKIERRAIEFRQTAPGIIEGTVIPYDSKSTIAGLFSETFEPGSIRYGSVLVNRQHDRARPLARLGFGLTLEDAPEALRARIELPDTVEGRDTRALIEAGVLRGLSAEFRAVREDWPSPTERIIAEAQTPRYRRCRRSRPFGRGNRRSTGAARSGLPARASGEGLAMRIFSRREDREGEAPVIDATETEIARMETGAIGREHRPEALAAMEIAAGFVGRAFASAVVSGPEAARLLPRGLLMMIGRTLTLRGELVMLPEGDGLVPSAAFDIRGGPGAGDWLYRCDVAGPSGMSSRFRAAPDVLHFRINVDPSQPWKGRAAHSLASATAATAARAEATAGKEAGVAVSRLIPVAQTLTPTQRGETTSDLASELKRGGYFALSLIGVSPGRGERMNRLSVEPVHPEPSTTHLELRRGAALEIIEATGVPSVLADPRAEANGQREAFRRFVHGTIEPMARLVEGEVSSKTGLECGLDFGSLFAADLAGRGRALKQMVESGVPLFRRARYGRIRRKRGRRLGLSLVRAG